ncbi:MAG TPA: tyrosine-type recombinase/integrase [Dyella sp.]|uniref:tyrosine-type recombinase/integrase n=1 Tax=Dyella sp. TaxID=1869338 RepID=UPI002C22934D|nr:tyrosine-type recombinase/integrase [Dyella sp.]HUB89062.1 tyrosine-type recombinase/integrase [Dyella sp.]
MAFRNVKLNTARDRARLDGRPDPYWSGIRKNLHLGFRKIESGETWSARYRDDSGKRQFKYLGAVKAGSAKGMTYDEAVTAAEAFAKACDAGITSSDVKTVGDACHAYVTDRRREKGDANADDAHGRFVRTVYGAPSSDTRSKAIKPHPIAAIPLDKLREADVKGWRAGLDMSSASANRYLAVLKAALNHAVSSRAVGADRAVEWASVKPKPANKRRDLTLNRNERRKLIASAEADARAFINALCLLPIRPQALADLTVKSFDKDNNTLHIGPDKGHAPRSMKLKGPALDLIMEQAKGKTPRAPLFAYPGGEHWNKERWKKPVKRAADAAKLPAETCAYTLRHSVITDLVKGGLDVASVATLAGTSILMIQKHYGHLCHDHAADALAGLAL